MDCINPEHDPVPPSLGFDPVVCNMLLQGVYIIPEIYKWHQLPSLSTTLHLFIQKDITPQGNLNEGCGPEYCKITDLLVDIPSARHSGLYGIKANTAMMKDATL